MFGQTPLMPRPKPATYAEQVRGPQYRPTSFFVAAPQQIPPAAPANAQPLASNLVALSTAPPPTTSSDLDQDPKCKPPPLPIYGGLHLKLLRVDGALDSPSYQT